MEQGSSGEAEAGAGMEPLPARGEVEQLRFDSVVQPKIYYSPISDQRTS